MTIVENTSTLQIMILTLALLAAVLWIWAIIDIIRLGSNSKEAPAPWILLILLFPIFGSIIYFQIGRRRMKGFGKTSQFSS